MLPSQPLSQFRSSNEHTAHRLWCEAGCSGIIAAREGSGQRDSRFLGRFDQLPLSKWLVAPTSASADTVWAASARLVPMTPDGSHRRNRCVTSALLTRDPYHGSAETAQYRRTHPLDRDVPGHRRGWPGGGTGGRHRVTKPIRLAGTHRGTHRQDGPRISLKLTDIVDSPGLRALGDLRIGPSGSSSCCPEQIT
jgi:hypothetical protein